jgi:hypothetical protein
VILISGCESFSLAPEARTMREDYDCLSEAARWRTLTGLGSCDGRKEKEAEEKLNILAK